jgi:5'-deoxynucleotidase YfbR-like HD superfamily hydrolase
VSVIEAGPDGRENIAGRGATITPGMIKLFDNTTHLDKKLGKWRELISIKKPNTGELRLNDDSNFKDVCYTSVTDEYRAILKRSLERKFKNEEWISRIVSSPGVSGNNLVKDPKILDEYKKIARDATHVEMELGGFMKGAIGYKTEGANLEIAAIRSISDVVGLIRSDEWADYARCVAATFAFSLIYTSALFDPDSSNPISLPNNTTNIKSVSKHSSASNVFSSPAPRFIEDMNKLSLENFKEMTKVLSRLFFKISEHSARKAIKLSEEGFLLELAEWIYRSKATDGPILRISGAVGTGKTTLLTAIATCIRRVHQQENEIVDYINVHEFDELPIEDGESASHYRLRISELLERRIQRFLATLEGRAAILFVDGFDTYRRDRISGSQERFLKAIRQHGGVKVVGVGNYPLDSELPAREKKVVPELGDMELKLIDFPVSDPAEVFKSFESTSKFMSRKSLSADQMKKICTHLSLENVDLLLLDILSHIQSPPGNVVALTESAILMNYLKEKMAKSYPDRELREMFDDVARYVYHEDVIDSTERGGESIDESIRFSICGWSICTAHPRIRSFLRAFHIISELSKQGSSRNNEEKLAPNEGFLFPRIDNVHAKWLLNSNLGGLSEKVDRDIVSYAERRLTPLLRKSTDLNESFEMSILRKDSEFSKYSHLVYLLGRIGDNNLRERAKVLLSALKRVLLDEVFPNLVKSIDKVRLDKTSLLLAGGMQEDVPEDLALSCAKLRVAQCCVLISLINVSPPPEKRLSCDLFLMLLGFEKWREMVCSFHLRYYKDRPFVCNISDFVANVENRGSFSRTISYVTRQFESAAVSNQKNKSDFDPLLNVSLAVLCALAINRKIAVGPQNQHNREDLEYKTTEIERVSSLLDKVSGFSFWNGIELICKLTKRIISVEGELYPQNFLLKMFELKGVTQRSGWITHLGLTGNVESIAEHCWGTMILAEVLLPEVATQNFSPEEAEQYNKSEIIRCLLMHEIGESVIGDWTLSDNSLRGRRTPEQTEAEQEWVKMFAILGIMPKWLPQVEFEARWQIHRDVIGINGVIVKTIDKLDALIQLVVLKRRCVLEGEKKYAGSERSVNDWRLEFEKDLKKVAKRSVFTESLISEWLVWVDFEWDRNGPMQYLSIFKNIIKFDGKADAPPIERIRL